MKKFVKERHAQKETSVQVRSAELKMPVVMRRVGITAKS